MSVLALFMEKKYKDCFNQCPQECTQITYKVKKATVMIGSDEVYKNIQRTVPSKANMTLTEIKEYFRYIFLVGNLGFCQQKIIKLHFNSSVLKLKQQIQTFFVHRGRIQD